MLKIKILSKWINEMVANKKHMVGRNFKSKK